MRGIVIRTKDEGTYGWIKPDEGEKDVFIHVRDLNDPLKTLYENEPLEFDIKETDKGLNAIDVRRLEPRAQGIVKTFERGFGFIERKDVDESIFFHKNDILTSDPSNRNISFDDDVEFSVSADEQGRPRAIRVIRAKRALDRFADIEDVDGLLRGLAKLAHNENWDYKFTKSKWEFPILYNYIYNTFERIFDENKVSVADTEKGKIACFNTGLVTEMQEEIFGVFMPNKSRMLNKAEWALSGFYRKSDRNLGYFGKKPDIANYFQEPSELLYDTRIELVVNPEHVINDNRHRFPEQLRDNPFALKAALDGTIEHAKSRVKRNYKTAIPQFYKNRIQLLLPLCLITPERADLALVIAREHAVYRGSTVLTLDMAYNNARLIARPDNEWLEP